jgi:hypothetical protein
MKQKWNRRFRLFGLSLPLPYGRGSEWEPRAIETELRATGTLPSRTRKQAVTRVPYFNYNGRTGRQISTWYRPSGSVSGLFR